ncbi:hypothetical protein GFS31_44510 (plasmid) [Leptolyngbya sp. BL0902]|nr:hypothetical protein GFS31_44510 [Leptolyngbya sp. BL0902]
MPSLGHFERGVTGTHCLPVKTHIPISPQPSGENSLILGLFGPSAEVDLPHFGLTLASL